MSVKRTLMYSMKRCSGVVVASSPSQLSVQHDSKITRQREKGWLFHPQGFMRNLRRRVSGSIEAAQIRRFRGQRILALMIRARRATSSLLWPTKQATNNLVHGVMCQSFRALLSRRSSLRGLSFVQIYLKPSLTCYKSRFFYATELTFGSPDEWCWR